MQLKRQNGQFSVDTVPAQIYANAQSFLNVVNDDTC